jgi:hypothetical protein
MKMMVKTATIGAALLLAGSALQAASLGAWGPAKGDWDFTLGGGGASDKNFNINNGAFNATVGYFITDALEVAVRQSILFSVLDDAADGFGGQTMLAVDYHFALGERWRPFVGASIGGIYGNQDTPDSGAAGLEVGVKYYALQKTYVFGTFGWAWNFNNDQGGDFEDGSFVYTAGVGFNF